jgi:cytochrome c-type biogenesis protein CcmH
MLVLFIQQSWAVDAKQFDTEQQRQTYTNLIEELRCLVCQNQNIADSNADLAKDLRRQVHEMVSAGKTEQDVIDYMVQRYGDFVVYKPQFQMKTWLLWLGPGVFIVIGFIVAIIYAKRNRKTIGIELNQQQKERLKKLLEDEDQL